jgi:hypothetical protein
MNIKELISHLEKYPQDLQVYFNNEPVGCYDEIDEIPLVQILLRIDDEWLHAFLNDDELEEYLEDNDIRRKAKNIKQVLVINS